MNITDELFVLKDEKYADFQSSLVPGIPRESFIGVRIPALRALAKRFRKEDPEGMEGFLRELPHRYYDENILHSILLSGIKEYDICTGLVDAFLPYVDNWAVCDTLSPEVYRRAEHRNKLMAKILEWTGSCGTDISTAYSGKDSIYTLRFGMEMLMRHFLDEDFRKEYLDIPAAVSHDDYYVKMMQAWFFAEALAKQWDSAVPYITEYRLEAEVHNRTIQKAVESFRISPERKEYLKKYRIRGGKTAKNTRIQ